MSPPDLFQPNALYGEAQNRQDISSDALDIRLTNQPDMVTIIVNERGLRSEPGWRRARGGLPLCT
jgi:hypothetical protein